MLINNLEKTHPMAGFQYIYFYETKNQDGLPKNGDKRFVMEVGPNSYQSLKYQEYNTSQQQYIVIRGYDPAYTL